MRTAVVSFGVLFFSLCVLAGEYVMNEDAARGLRVVFSEPVFITGFGDVLANVTPEGEASEFTFYGGELEPWVGHWMSWKPATAVLVRSEWLSGAPGTFEEEATQREAQVTGQLLNAAYFAHPAYVMQGVSDRDRVFAMPLAGISELGFYPLRSGVSPDAVAWCVEVNDQGLIEATIDAGVLYIWAATDRSAGAGTAHPDGCTGLWRGSASHHTCHGLPKRQDPHSSFRQEGLLRAMVLQVGYQPDSVGAETCRGIRVRGYLTP